MGSQMSVSRIKRLGIATICVVAVVASVLAIVALIRPGNEPEQAPVRQPLAVFLGDSYAEGSQVEVPQRYVSIVSEAMHWTLENRSEGGTGYVTDGPVQFPDRAPFTDRIDEIIALHPDVVVVAGGLNDANRDYSEDELRAAISATFGKLQEGLPDATIIALGPIWPDGKPNRSVIQVNDIIREVAVAADIPYIDPITSPWITGSRNGLVEGNRDKYIGEDGTHPSVEGQAYIARKLIEELTALGIAPA